MFLTRANTYLGEHLQHRRTAFAILLQKSNYDLETEDDYDDHDMSHTLLYVFIQRWSLS